MMASFFAQLRQNLCSYAKAIYKFSAIFIVNGVSCLVVLGSKKEKWRRNE